MGKRKGPGKAVKKNRAPAGAEAADEEHLTRAPHSFVVHRGLVGKSVQDLTKDFRQVMEPYTASNIKVRPKNVIKDFVHVAGLLNVSHLCAFTKTDLGPYLKLARFPRGPTLTFRVRDYTLARDVKASLKRQITYEKQFQNHALLVMNSFTGEGREIQLMASMFQNMFPTINVNTVKVNTVRRCVLLNYNAEAGTVDFRHYTIKVVPVGMSRGVKKIVQGKVPNLSRYDDVADFLARSGNLSESEGEGDESANVTLPPQQGVSSRGNVPATQSSVRLVELGPRMTLELIKIEEGLMDGEVLYHSLVEKTDEEKRAIRVTREKRKKEKERRKSEQNTNVKKKEQAKEKHKVKSLGGMLKSGQVRKEDLPKEFQGEEEDEPSSEDDDDAAWFEKEVGQKPDKDMFETSTRDGRKRPRSTSKDFHGANKRFKKEKPGGAKKVDGKFGRKDKPGGGKKFDGGNNRDGKKPKRKTQVFNSQGVGPNYNKRQPNKGPRVVAKRGGRR